MRGYPVSSIRRVSLSAVVRVCRERRRVPGSVRLRTRPPVPMSLSIIQYPLALSADDPPSFDNFMPGRNREAMRAVRESADGRGHRYLYLAGPAGTGKTHLLVAAARAAAGFYLDLGDPGIGPGATESLETARLVCLDEVGAAAARPDWEQALFRLFNALESAGPPLIVAARSHPGRLGLELPDLVSRLASGPVLGLAGPGESELERILVSRARARGFELPPHVAAYLVTRERRDVPHLLALLDRLDRHSLAARRPVTIPFVRSLIEKGGQD